MLIPMAIMMLMLMLLLLLILMLMMMLPLLQLMLMMMLLMLVVVVLKLRLRLRLRLIMGWGCLLTTVLSYAQSKYLKPTKYKYHCIHAHAHTGKSHSLKNNFFTRNLIVYWFSIFQCDYYFISMLLSNILLALSPLDLKVLTSERQYVTLWT